MDKLRFAASAALFAAALTPVAAQAQALSCAIPTRVPRPVFDGPDAKQPVRVLPIGSYTLALTWSPQYCRGKGTRHADRFQCAGDNRFGFTLHGLWPDGYGKEWPQYCKPSGILPQAVIRENMCVTPSAQLIQHEWAKHGTCMNTRPDQYFGLARKLYAEVRYPDMTALARTPNMTAGRFADAVAAVNHGLRSEMMRITANKKGYLDEIWLCLDRRFNPTRCPVHQGGLNPRARLKIEPPR